MRFLDEYNKQLKEMSLVQSMSYQSEPQANNREASGPVRASSYVPGERSGKWSELQHMYYIVFIDYNREKMRSKQKRSSNKFYQQMSRFISTRNALQCRSHHQKLEEKYVHINKIINIFKNSFNRTAYKEARERLDVISHQKQHSNSVRSNYERVVSVEVNTQTEISGTDLQFVNVNPNLIVIRPRGYQLNYSQSPTFYPHMFGQMNMEMSGYSTPSPTFYNQMGAWGCNFNYGSGGFM